MKDTSGISTLSTISKGQLLASKRFKVNFVVSVTVIFLALLVLGSTTAIRSYMHAEIENAYTKITERITKSDKASSARLEAVGTRVSKLEEDNEKLRSDMDRLTHIIFSTKRVPKSTQESVRPKAPTPEDQLSQILQQSK